MRIAVITLIVVGAFCAAAQGWAQTSADASARAWETYLHPDERGRLEALVAKATEAAPMEADSTAQKAHSAAPPPADTAQMAEGMRQGFAGFAAQLAPPLDDVKFTATDALGVRGVWFTPKGAAKGKVLLYFHGGGYVAGSPMTAASTVGYLAKAAKLRCFSLDYPLAPEHPYPAAPENALAAYRMLLDKGYKPGSIVLAGDSAGGGLVLAALLRIREAALPMPAGAFLLSPWTDLTQTAETYARKSTVDVALKQDMLQWMATVYAAGQDVRTPGISPLHADLRGLPPLLVHVGSYEILLDDSLALARNAALADVPVTLRVWPGYGHVFQMMHGHLEGGRKSLEEGAAFFKEVLSGKHLRPAAAK